MRKKKHGEERIQACAALLCEKPETPIVAPTHHLADAPLCLEIGCGKGGFACDMAEKHPDRTFYAMEKYEKRVETAGQSWTIMCCENEILSLPSAQPERKTGHWIEHKTQIADHTVYTYECSECGNSMIVKPTRFCGHCGAKMEEKTDGDM